MNKYCCELCGLWPDDCICPECPVCGDYGNPNCYEDHGLTISQQQKLSLETKQAQWTEEARRESEYWAEMFREETQNE